MTVSKLIAGKVYDATFYATCIAIHREVWNEAWNPLWDSDVIRLQPYDATNNATVTAATEASYEN